MPLKILVCHPGHAFSTADVHDGLVEGLRELGHEVLGFNLSARIPRARSWLDFAYRRARKRLPDLPRPTPADVVYRASVDLLEVGLRELPDWVLFVTGSAVHPDVATLLRRAGGRLAVVFTESPYEDGPQAAFLRHVDLAFTNERTSVPVLRRANPEVHYLPHAHRPERHHPGLDTAGMAAHDVVFVGTGFPERVELLSTVDWTGVDLGLYGTWKALDSRHRLRRFVRGGVVDNAHAAALYANARVGLNLYRTSGPWGRPPPDVARAESLNPRAHELAAVGCFQLAEYRAESAEVFGEAVPTFRAPGELGPLLRRWLPDEAGRRRLADLARARVAGRTWRANAEVVAHHLAGAVRPRIHAVGA